MNTPLAELLSKQFPDLKFFSEERLASHTYFKLGGPAEAFVQVFKREELEKVVIFSRQNSIPLTVLGGGSNVLVADEGIRGLVIKNLTHAIAVKEVTEIGGTIEVDSGVPTNLLVRTAVNASLQGIERLLGVPGSVGGAVYNNSHFSHNELIGKYVTNVHVIDTQGRSKIFTHKQVKFAYDYSIFQETHDTIIWVEFSFPKGERSALEQIVLEATKKRTSTQPLGVPSSGCMFKNVTLPDGSKVGAGYLIDQAGLKGTKVGGAMVSDVHANFIVNTGDATQRDVEELAKLVEKTIKEKFGVELRREVFRLGGA